MAEQQPLTDDDQLLRLVAPVQGFVGEGGRPTWRALRPTDADTKDATDRGIPVRVSFWDLRLTTTVEAEAFLPPKERNKYSISVGALKFPDEPLILPIRDPIVSPQANYDKPGALGHCGVEGFDKRDKDAETVWKARLAKVAALLIART